MSINSEILIPILKKGIDQVAILVPDLMRAVEQYYEKFGIGPWHIYTYKKPLVNHMTYYGKPADYQMRIGLSYIGSMRIELIQPLGGESIYSDFIKKHGYGVHHFGIVVEDINEAIRQAKEAGYQVIMDGSGFGLEGDGHYAYLDTEVSLGVTLELISRPENRVEPEMIYPPEGLG
jgi:hypothetical protein